MLPFMTRRGRPDASAPACQTYAAIADGSETNYLRVAPADFNLEVTKWHGFAWLYFNSMPVNDGDLMATVSQHNNVPEDSAFATGVVKGVPVGNVFVLVTCHEELGVHEFTNTFALNWQANHGEITTGTWYFLDFSLDADGSETTIRVNAASDGKDVGAVTGVVSCVATVDLRDQMISDGPHFGVPPMDGRIGQVGFRRGSLWTDAEITYIYNNGCQRLMANWNLEDFPDIQTDLYALWEMQETDGTRDNAQGTAARDFLQVGFVGQECGTC